MTAPSQHSAGDQRLTPQNPWPGLAAFTAVNHDFFCGRANEIAEISRRVRRQMLTVLFGVSGLGKTSLLQAGLLPKLGGTQFYPILVGLDHRPESGDLCEQVRAAINREIPHATAAGVVVPRGSEPGEDLWGYFHDKSTDWHNARGELVYPVLVFDQFEEIFTREIHTRAMEERRDRFIELLACLVENRAPDSLMRQVDHNAGLAERIDFRQDDFRVVISLREDFLAHLESFKWRMPSVMENRMRLTPMSEEQALQVVLGPGSEIVDEPVARKIVAFVAGTAREGQTGTTADSAASSVAEPVLLSLLCEQLNRLRLERGQERITEELVSQQGADILQRFYDESFDQFPPGEQEAIREYVAKNLVTAAGFRNPVARENACAELAALGVANPDEAIEALIKRRLLTSERRGGTQRLELTHDKLAPLVMRARNERIAREKELQAKKLAAEAAAREAQFREQLWRSRRQTMVFAGLLVCAVVALIWGLVMRGKMQVMHGQVEDLSKKDKSMEERIATNQAILVEVSEAAWKIFEPLWQTMLDDQRPVEASLVRLNAMEQFNWSPDRFVLPPAPTNEDGTVASTFDSTSTIFTPGKTWQLPAGNILQILPVSDGLLVVSRHRLSPETTNSDASLDSTNSDTNSDTGLGSASKPVIGSVLTHISFSGGPDEISALVTNDSMYLTAHPEDPELFAVAVNSDPLPHLARFDPTNRILVTLSSPGTDSGQAQATSGTNTLNTSDYENLSPSALAFSPDGRWLAAGYYGGTLSLFRVESNRSLFRVYSRTFSNSYETLSTVAFTEGGEVILAGGDTLSTYRRSDGSPTGDGEYELQVPAAVSPDGYDEVCISRDQIAHLHAYSSTRGDYSTDYGKRFSFSSDARPAVAAFSPRGDYTIFGLEDGSIRVDIKTLADEWQFQEVMKAHESSVTAVTPTPDGRGFYSGDWSGAVRYFRLADKPFPISNLGTNYSTLSAHYGLQVVKLSQIEPVPSEFTNTPPPVNDGLTGDYWRSHWITESRRTALSFGIPRPITNINLSYIFAPLASYYSHYNDRTTNDLVIDAGSSTAFLHWLDDTNPIEDPDSYLPVSLRPQERLAFLTLTQSRWESQLTPAARATCYLAEAGGYDARLQQWNDAIGSDSSLSSLSQSRSTEILDGLACLQKAVDSGATNWDDIQANAYNLLPLPQCDDFCQSNAPPEELLDRARGFINKDDTRAVAFFDAFTTHGGEFTVFNDARNYGILLRNINRMSDAERFQALAGTLATNADEMADSLITRAFTIKVKNQDFIDSHKADDPKRLKIEADIMKLAQDAVQLAPDNPLVWKNVSRLQPITDAGRAASVDDLKTALKFVSSLERASYTIELCGKLYDLHRDEEAATNIAAVVSDITTPALAKDYWEMICDHFSNLQQASDATAILDSVLALNGGNNDDDVDWLYFYRGAQMCGRYRFTEALADLDKIADRGFNPSWTLSERAEAFRQFGDFQRSEADFKATFEKDPKNDWAFAKYSSLLLDRGLYTNALAAARTSYNLKSTEWYAFITACAFAKQWDEGHAALDGVLTNQAATVGWNMTKTLFLLRESGWDTNRAVPLPPGAKKLIESSEAMERKMTTLDHEQLALMFIYLGRYDDAATEIQAQVQAWPDDPEMAAVQAALYAERGQPGDKLRAFASLADAASRQYYQAGLISRMPSLRALHDDSRYQEFLQDLKLPSGGPAERDIVLTKFTRALLDQAPESDQALRDSLQATIDRLESHWRNPDSYPAEYLITPTSAAPRH